MTKGKLLAGYNEKEYALGRIIIHLLGTEQKIEN
jgi:hypothetical protein